ncbi:hypoxanthine-guanine phosphoribosyltransferase-like [Oscarella lobularis]|uniref:hypoxanthine-guanine phosphoribosyltransferase-like n=1 Tax=Oscarella lobularis TaxID=121494 RepID=UPI0033136499
MSQKRVAAIKIEDDPEGYPLGAFCIPAHYADYLEKIIIPLGVVKDRTEKLARDIVEDIGDGPIVALCVLKGGHQFFHDLLEWIQIIGRTSTKNIMQIRVDFIRLKSYVNEESTGEVQIIGNDDLNGIRGRNVLVVEDIVDTGKTMEKLLGELKKYEPKMVKVASLLTKRSKARIHGQAYTPEYVGFDVPKKFVVGYSLDYNEYFRDLGHICLINEKGKEKFKSD